MLDEKTLSSLRELSSSLKAAADKLDSQGLSKTASANNIQHSIDSEVFVQVNLNKYLKAVGEGINHGS